MYDIIHQINHRARTSGSKMSEMGELYVSTSMKTLGLSLIGIFIPIYLIEVGFSLVDIAGFYLLSSAYRIYVDIVGAKLILKFGPKHLMSLSYLFLLLTLASFATIENIGLPLPFIAFLYAISMGFFILPFDYDFSVSKSKKSDGAQIGNHYILQKLSSAIGPIIGGVIATYFGLQVSIYVAMIFILAAALPLFLTSDIFLQNNQNMISFRKFATYWRAGFATSGFGLQKETLVILWPMFLALAILDEQVYVSIGVIFAIGIILSVASSHVSGKLSDSGKTGKILNLSSIAIGLSNIIRPFTNSLGSAIGINLMSEMSDSAFRVSFLKGIFSNAVKEGPDRLNFLLSISIYLQIFRVAYWGIILLLFIYVDEITSIKLGFLLSALAIILVRAYKPGFR